MNDDRAHFVVSELSAAAKHDRDCDEEGEGECCMRAWRRTLIAAGLARNVTDDEQMDSDYRFRDFTRTPGGSTTPEDAE